MEGIFRGIPIESIGINRCLGIGIDLLNIHWDEIFNKEVKDVFSFIKLTRKNGLDGYDDINLIRTLVINKIIYRDEFKNIGMGYPCGSFDIYFKAENYKDICPLHIEFDTNNKIIL